MDDDGVADDGLPPQPTTCGVGECSGNTGEEFCIDGSWSGDTCDPFEGAVAEICNGVDDDCDGESDEEGADGCTVYYRDYDGDAYGLTDDNKCLCEAEDFYTAEEGGDCDDSDENIYPGATELCDGLDNDCDAAVPSNEVDDDSDGYVECTIDAGGWDGDPFVIGGDDCDDSDENVNPDSTEVCNGIDDDCDGEIDEDLIRATTCGLGACAGNTGEETCTAGVWGDDTCDPFAGASEDDATCDGVDDSDDDMIEDQDPEGDPDHGIPDWHPKSKHKN